MSSPYEVRDRRAGAVYHVWNRGIGGRTVFADRADREAFLRLLADRAAGGWLARPDAPRPIAYALMRSHFHIVLRMGADPEGIWTLMQRLVPAHVKTFNHRHERSGALFARRYRDRLVVDAADLHGTVAYVHLNPAEEHRQDVAHSSHALYARNHGPPWLDVRLGLSPFGDERQYRDQMRTAAVFRAARRAARHVEW